MSEIKQTCKYIFVTGYSLMIPILPSSETQSQNERKTILKFHQSMSSPPIKKPKEFCKQIASLKASHFLLVQIQSDSNNGNSMELALEQTYRNKIEIN